MTIKKLLIANRGEIVTRILRTSHRLGLETVVIFSAHDAERPYVKEATQAIKLYGDSLDQTYLNQQKIIDIARSTGADAIHPGYGFLSENADFAQRCIQNGLIWVGPSPSIMRRMADKTQARNLAENINIPVIPAFSGSKKDPLDNLTEKDYPILLKAAAGGGGRGMRIVRKPSELREQIRLAADEARLAFGDDRLFIEKYLEKAKHIEVQIMGDQHGNYLHFFERECTIQRRYQKIIEESPSPSISPRVREKLTSAAIALARASKYNNAGTVEFLVTPDGEYYFIETNARIQVEHPVSEMVTGHDLVELQIRVAEGQPLTFRQEDIRLNGHALECRICAESPQHHFAPYPGTVRDFYLPDDPDSRVDSALFAGSEISALYDSLIAKLIVHTGTRELSVEKARSLLKKSAFPGIETNIPYLIEVMDHSEFRSAEFDTTFIERNHRQILDQLGNKRSNGYTDIVLAAYGFLKVTPAMQPPTGNPWKDLGYWRALSLHRVEIDEQVLEFELEHQPENEMIIQLGQKKNRMRLSLSESRRLVISNGDAEFEIYWNQDEQELSFSVDGQVFRLFNPLKRIAANGQKVSGSDRMQIIRAPLPGKLSRILVNEGETVENGQTLAIIESMKVENQIMAPEAGTIRQIELTEGTQVSMKQTILTIEPN